MEADALPIIAALLIACTVLLASVAALGALWWSERDRRRAAERSGAYKPVAVHRTPDTAERRARKEAREQEARRIREVADELEQEARRGGQRFSRAELEAEAKRILMNAGAGGFDGR